MKKLQYVPQGLDKTYNAVLDLNFSYNKLNELVLEDGGFNYIDYISNLDTAKLEEMANVEKIEMKIPKKK